MTFYHWYPNEKGGLILDLQKPAPKELTDLRYIQPIISTYNPYLIYFIKDLLNLLTPQLPKANITQICTLANLISPNFKSNQIASNIYTVKDVKSILNKEKYDSESDVEIVEETLNKYIDDEELCTGQPNGIWKRASKKYDWSVYPIGVLPWQHKLEHFMEVHN